MVIVIVIMLCYVLRVIVMMMCCGCDVVEVLRCLSVVMNMRILS